MTTRGDADRAAETPPDTEAQPEQKLGWGDYIVPASIFLFCGVVTYVSTTLEEALPIIVGNSMQPRVFPIFLMAVIAVLNIVLIFQIRAHRTSNEPYWRQHLEPRQTWLSAVLLGVFYLLTEFVDMMLGLIVVMFALCIVWGERRWWVAGLVAFGTTAAIFFSFDQILQVRFPRGLLTDWYYG